ncbi:polymorphic toxin-type HINT domain-containing protein [Streptomyces microflavus]|uniref:polymorphic toxin-type HINT domain-containing protein n=1 Tax=Streptomyces microflavus TaxID=1919 RepID=UPI0033FE8FE9
MSLKDFIHLRLDVLGLFPVLGEAADGVNCLAYAGEFIVSKYGIGEKDAWKDALLSCASMVPIFGYAAAPTKAARWAGKYGGKVGGVFEAIGNFFKKSPCKPKNSFPAGTRVLMADGSHLPIERVRIDDLVHAADPLTGSSGPRRVTATIHTPDDRDFTDISLTSTMGDGPLTSTANHPFWSVNAQAWTLAADLNAGDRLLSADGNPVEIREINHWQGLQAAYNLTVSGLHTYYVLAGGKPVLVHNSGESGPAFETAPTKLRKLSDGEVQKMVGDMHLFKEDVLRDAGARDRIVSHYDIYVDKSAGYLFRMPKNQKSYIPTLLHQSGEYWSC